MKLFETPWLRSDYWDGNDFVQARCQLSIVVCRKGRARIFSFPSKTEKIKLIFHNRSHADRAKLFCTTRPGPERWYRLYIDSAENLVGISRELAKLIHRRAGADCDVLHVECWYR